MESYRRIGSGRILTGLVIVLIGIFLLVSNLGLLGPELNHIVFSWPSILVFFGIIALINSNYRGGFILLAIGGFFLVSRYYYMDLWTMWPILLIILGIYTLLGSRYHHHHHSKHYYDKEKYKEYYKDEYGDWQHPHYHHHHHDHYRNRGFADMETENVEADMIDENVVFRGSKKSFSSSDFKGGRISAIFGGTEIDLSNCNLSPEGNNIIDIVAIFGGATIYVPNDWKVIMDITPVFGGFADERRRMSNYEIDEKKVIIIKGTMVFGGGKIMSASKK